MINQNRLYETIKLEIKNQIPVLMNSYQRVYYQSLDKKLRLTLDNNQRFYKINRLRNNLVNSLKDNSSMIVELKYTVQDEEYVNDILKYFPYSLTKSSKYARGVDLIYL